MQHADIYQSLLKEVGIIQDFGVTADTTPQPNILTCCGPVALDAENGCFLCWRCGKVLDPYHYVYDTPYTKANEPFGSRNTHTIVKKRFYKPLTHFKEHLRRYLGARFTAYPVGLLDDLRADPTIHVQHPACYFQVQRALRKRHHPKLYKEIFQIIHMLGGHKPLVTPQQYQRCIAQFTQLQYRFFQLRHTRDSFKRKNMPSMYVVMDFLLKQNGHVRFYDLPHLKDPILQERVEELYRLLCRQ